MTSPPARPASRWPMLLGAIVVVGLLAFAGRAGGGLLVEAIGRLQALGPWGPVAFVALYVVACLTAIPGSILTLAAGAVFGVVGGVAAAFTGAMLGSAAAFLVARFVAREAIARRIGADPRFAAIDRAIAARGYVIVLLIRLSPVFPFTIINFAFGLTRVSLADYLLGGLGMLPGTLLYVYYGKVAGDVVAVAAGGGTAPNGPGYYAVLALGLAATLAVTLVVTRTARRALAEATSGDI